MDTNRIKAIDSLSAYEFQVEIDGKQVSGIFRVSGLTSFTLEGEVPPLVITKMVQQDQNAPFNAWTREAQAGDVRPRTVAIVAVDEGTETRRWVFHEATIIQISFSDFDSSSSELVEERVVIKAQRVEEIWS